MCKAEGGLFQVSLLKVAGLEGVWLPYKSGGVPGAGVVEGRGRVWRPVRAHGSRVSRWAARGRLAVDSCTLTAARARPCCATRARASGSDVLLCE